MPRPCCTACGGSTSTPRNFLLVCTCGSARHHRCTNPPVEQRALLAMIAATNRKVHVGSVEAWRCETCVARGEDRGEGASTGVAVEARLAGERERPRHREQAHRVPKQRSVPSPPAPVWPPVRRKKRAQERASDSVEHTPEDTITVTKRPPTQASRRINIQTPETKTQASRAPRLPYPLPTSIRRVSPQKPPAATARKPPARVRSPPWRVPSPVPFTPPSPHEVLYRAQRAQRRRSSSPPIYLPPPAAPSPSIPPATPVTALPQIDLRQALRRKHSAILRHSTSSRNTEGPLMKRRKTEEGPSNAAAQNETDDRSEKVAVVEQDLTLPPSPVASREHVLQRHLSLENDSVHALGLTKELNPTKQEETSEPQATTYPGSDPITPIEIDPTEQGATPQPGASAKAEPDPEKGVEPAAKPTPTLHAASAEPETKHIGELQELPHPRASTESETGSGSNPANDFEATEATAHQNSSPANEVEVIEAVALPHPQASTEPDPESTNTEATERNMDHPMLPENVPVTEDDPDTVAADNGGQEDLRKNNKRGRSLSCSLNEKPTGISKGIFITEKRRKRRKHQASEAPAEADLVPSPVDEVELTAQIVLPRRKPSAEPEPELFLAPKGPPEIQNLHSQPKTSTDLGVDHAKQVGPTPESVPQSPTEPPPAPNIAHSDPEVAPEDNVSPIPPRTAASLAAEPKIVTPRSADPAPKPTECSLLHSPPPPEASLPTPRSRSPRERKGEKAAVNAQQPAPSKLHAPVLARWFKEIVTGQPRRRGREKVVAKMRGESEGGAEWSFVAR